MARANYIQRLQDENKGLLARDKAIGEGMVDLELYLLSGKFKCGDVLDGYVHISDILHRIGEIRDNANRAHVP